jgi:hypothetical protein
MAKSELLSIKQGSELDIDFSYKHPSYIEMYANWIKNRDFVAGTDHIKARSYADLNKYQEDILYTDTITTSDNMAGTAYLPIPSGMVDDPKLYRDYLDRAQYYNATGMTTEAYIGMLYRKPPVYQFEKGNSTDIEELEDEINKKVLRKVTPTGKSFTELAKIISNEVIQV